MEFKKGLLFICGKWPIPSSKDVHKMRFLVPFFQLRFGIANLIPKENLQKGVLILQHPFEDVHRMGSEITFVKHSEKRGWLTGK